MTKDERHFNKAAAKFLWAVGDQPISTEAAWHLIGRLYNLCDDRSALDDLMRVWSGSATKS